MRQMEEQFTSYDFRKMKRRSYYPHNQQIISTVTASSSVGVASSRPGTPAMNGGLDSTTVSRNEEGYPPTIPSTKMVPMEMSDSIAIARCTSHLNFPRASDD
ncbi:hypothetical protein FRC03_000296 [Tulasnella sp. 419]|nr:hypothetical protein FRC03_000296 [Tulasnella sp. 419]